jgi:hypothetical protein
MLLRATDHGIGVGAHVVHSKGGPDQPPLAPPHITLTRQEPVADDVPERLCHVALAEVMVITRQDRFDVVWLAQQVRLGTGNAVMGDGSVVARTCGKETEWIATKLEEIADEGVSWGTWCVVWRRHRINI